jgi:hypothetical protein
VQAHHCLERRGVEGLGLGLQGLAAVLHPLQSSLPLGSNW